MVSRDGRPVVSWQVPDRPDPRHDLATELGNLARACMARGVPDTAAWEVRAERPGRDPECWSGSGWEGAAAALWRAAGYVA